VSDHEEIDPQWEQNRIRGNLPQVENGGVPEQPFMLEPVFLPTLRDRTLDGTNLPDDTSDIVEREGEDEDEDTPLYGLLSDSEVRRGIAANELRAMDGANSVALERPRSESRSRTESESVSEESRNNLFPSERGVPGIGASRRRPSPPQRPISPQRPTTAMGSFPGASGRQRPRPMEGLNSNPGMGQCESYCRG
jgi:hypothetical protein